MANIQSGGEIPQPVEVNPDDLVMLTYQRHDPLQIDQLIADQGSVERAEDYLIQRYVEDPTSRTRLVGQSTGIRLPSIVREPAGTKEVSRLRKADGWFIRPSVAVAGSILSFGAFAINSHGVDVGQNADGIAHATAQSARVVGHDIYRLFNPVQSRTIHTTIPGKLVHISTNVASHDKVGAFSINQAAVQKFESKVESAIAHRDTLKSITAFAETSDEYGSDASIGQPSQGNTALGNERAATAAAAVNAALKGKIPDKAPLVTKTKEFVLSSTKKAKMEAEARSDGYTNLYDAIGAYDNGQAVSQPLAEDIKQQITSKRGVILTAVLGTHEKAKHLVRHVKGKDNPPADPDLHLLPFVPIPPVRRRVVEKEIRERKKWHFIPAAAVKRPKFITEDQENAWVRLRPEALQEDGTLVPNPWAYSRKYEHLMRDDRIKQVLRADFETDTQEQRSLRIMFVDHEPSHETIGVFTETIKRFAAIQSGSLADKISGIFVYPQHQAGLEPADPKRIGLGVDKQSPLKALGSCTPILELVEMHMPQITDPDEMLAYLRSFVGAHWTLAHEVAGHGSDISDVPASLIPVSVRGIPNAHIIKGEPFREVMKPLEKTLRKLTPPSRWHRRYPRYFDIEYPVTDLDGNIVTMQARVSELDPRFGHATEASIVGHRNTRYAGQDNLEHHAETVASTFTGIRVPFDEADVTRADLLTDSGEVARFIEGYRPDQRAQDLAAAVLGANQGSFPLDFSNMPNILISLTKPEDDSLLRQEMIRSRSDRFPRPDELIAILARIIRRDNKA